MLKPTSWIWDNSESAYVNKTHTTSAYTVLEDADDRWYLGFERRFEAIYFALGIAGSYTDLTIKLWDGDSWEEFGCIYELTASSFVRWNMREDMKEWTRMAFEDTSPHNGTPPDEIQRFWIQISASAVTTAAQITSLELSPYAHYTTPRKVSEFLQQADEGFDESSLPEDIVVEDFIRRAEARIDRITKQSWRLNYVESELQEFYYGGMKVVNAPIRKGTVPTTNYGLLSVKIWQGTSWRTLTIGRTGECYAQEDLGMVYFTRFFVPVFVPYSGGGAVMPFVYLYMMRHNVEFEYLFGHDFEKDPDAGAVEHIAILMTCISLMQEYERSILTKSGVDRIEMSARVRDWQKEAEEGLKVFARSLVVW